MSRYDTFDIRQELIELCKDLQSQIHQQLIYYRASAYKTETASLIDTKLKQLRLVVDLLACEETSDYFLDFEATRGNGNLALAPGECLLSWRVSELFRNLEDSFQVLLQNQEPLQSPEFARNIRKNGRKLASLCPQGSRKRSFFETL